MSRHYVGGFIAIAASLAVVFLAQAASAQERIPTTQRTGPPTDFSRPFAPQGGTPIAPPMAPPTPKPDSRISVLLKDGSRIVGKLVGLEKLKLTTLYGEISVPLDSISGIKFADSSNPAAGPASGTTVLFRNGDVLTAEPAVASLKLETSWGEASIAVKHLESIIMTAERLAWVNDGRWRLVGEGQGPQWRPELGAPSTLYPGAAGYVPTPSYPAPSITTYAVPTPIYAAPVLPPPLPPSAAPEAR